MLAAVILRKKRINNSCVKNISAGFCTFFSEMSVHHMPAAKNIFFGKKTNKQTNKQLNKTTIVVTPINSD